MAVEQATLAPPRLGVEDVLREGGLTRFHRRAILVTGAAWTFVAMEILLVGFTVPLFTELWGLSGSYAGWIAASALGGSLLGSVVLGRLADRIGRRRVFQASILWYALRTRNAQRRADQELFDRLAGSKTVIIHTRSRDVSSRIGRDGR